MFHSTQTRSYDHARGLPDSPPRVRGFEQLKTIIEQETAVAAIVVAVVDVVADFVAVVAVVVVVFVVVVAAVFVVVAVVAFVAIVVVAVVFLLLLFFLFAWLGSDTPKAKAWRIDKRMSPKAFPK